MEVDDDGSLSFPDPQINSKDNGNSSFKKYATIFIFLIKSRYSDKIS